MTTELGSHRRPESVLVLVYTGTGEVLLLLRTSPENFWQSVTGSLEFGESALEAARRELQEETGLSAELVDHQISTLFEIKPPWRARYAPEVTHNREHRFSARLESPVEVRMAPEEHVEARWLSAEAALELASSETNRQAIRDIALPLAAAL